MLVLTRCEGERIRVGDNVWVTLVESHRGRAAIGIDAPGMPIIREELIGMPPKPQHADRLQQLPSPTQPPEAM